jgi:hypothetical protein
MDGTVLWQTLLAVATAVFTSRSYPLFREIATGWTLCVCRRTVTGMMPFADPGGHRAHDSYHRFLRDGAWKTTRFWHAQTVGLIQALCPADGPVHLLVDDSIVHKSGRKVEDAGVFRDPVRSTVRKIVYAFGLNVVLLCVCVRLPGRPQPVALPVNARLYVKGGPSHVELTAIMVRELAAWLPDRRFRLVGDGAYASLASASLPRTHVTSRLRRDAALFDPPRPRRPGQRGRPAKKGTRLPNPQQIATQTAPDQWRLAPIRLRDRTVDRLLHTRVVLWYEVTGATPVLLVIVRDPKGHEHDDFFFTTDTDATPAAVVAEYADRWAIEVTFREVKQHLTPQHPQCWRRCGPERAVTLGFWLYSTVWLWFMQACGDQPAWPVRAWYPRKCSASFADALGTLRATLWRQRLSGVTATAPEFAKLADAMVDALARAG